MKLMEQLSVLNMSIYKQISDEEYSEQYPYLQDEIRSLFELANEERLKNVLENLMEYDNPVLFMFGLK
jgi:hypothetical protein